LAKAARIRSEAAVIKCLPPLMISKFKKKYFFRFEFEFEFEFEFLY